MRFTMTPDGVERLAAGDPAVVLDPKRVCREFYGPPVREGLLGGFTRGELGWAKKQLKVTRTDAIDVTDARLLYYILAMRHADHTLLSISHFDALALTDFELVQHVPPGLDRDGDCAECSMPLDHPVHLEPEPDDLPADELPPTPAGSGPATSETSTS
jgi:hypothetical protein